MRILHLSDTHIQRAPGPNRHGVDPTASLRLMLDALKHLRDVDVVLVTGDVADDGSVEAYTLVRELVGAYARERNVPLLLTTGNHDERQAFAKVLGSGHLAPAGRDRAESVITSPEGERAAVSTIAGYRFVTLDSLVPGRVHGHLSTRQLDWLRQVLSRPAASPAHGGGGTVLAFHHPPVTLNVPSQKAFGLWNPAELADAIRGSDVQVVLTGHFHLQLSGLLDGTPVWVTPGVVNRIDLTTEPGAERAVRGASATLVDLGGPSSPMFHTFHAPDPRAHEVVYDLDVETSRAVVARWGPGGKGEDVNAG